MKDPTLIACWPRYRSGRKSTAVPAICADWRPQPAYSTDAFSSLHGDVQLFDPAPVERVLPDGHIVDVEHGRHLVATVRPEAPIQLLLTGHMDTVFAEDHSFQQLSWLDEGVLNGPGVADMKGGIAVMLAALSAAETAPEFASVGYQVHDQQR